MQGKNTISQRKWPKISAPLTAEQQIISDDFTRHSSQSKMGIMSFKKILKTEIIRYLLVGAATATVYFLAIALCLEALLLEYQISLSIAYFISVAFHFLANRKYTFSAQNRSVRIQMVRYIILLLVNYIITLVVASLMVNQFDISHYKSTFFAIFATAAVGYLASKFWIFNKKEHMHVK